MVSVLTLGLEEKFERLTLQHFQARGWRGLRRLMSLSSSFGGSGDGTATGIFSPTAGNQRLGLGRYLGIDQAC